MKVKVIDEFYDLKEDTLRQLGDTFEVSPERFNEILSRGGNWVEEVKTPTKKVGAKNGRGEKEKA